MQTAGDSVTGLQLQPSSSLRSTQAVSKWQSDVKGEKLTVGDAYEPAFKKYAEWIDSGCVAKAMWVSTPHRRTDNFVAGKVGLYTNGSWFAATLDKAGRLPLGGVLPSGRRRRELAGAAGATMANPLHGEQGSSRARGRCRAAGGCLVTEPAAVETQLGSDGVFGRVPRSSRAVWVPRSRASLDDGPELVGGGTRATSGCP